MKTMEKQAEIMNMLVEINNDRIEGYTKAIELLPKDENFGLRSVFENYRDQSVQFNAELIPLVLREGEEPEDDTRASGKLFRAWMDVKAALAPSTTKAVLESCERGEDACKSAYNDALDNAEHLEASIQAIVQSQAQLQRVAHDHIKELRDSIE